MYFKENLWLLLENFRQFLRELHAILKEFHPF